jgi:hypothetical protein
MFQNGCNMHNKIKPTLYGEINNPNPSLMKMPSYFGVMIPHLT